MMDLGSKWFKCDLHLHTTSSLCFKDKTVTAQKWVQECIDKGLDCVAITDHNTGSGIEAIKDEAKKHGLHVFPGVEITCDSSKVHLLVLFDLDTDYKEIEDFLIRCDIDREKFGKQDAFTLKTIFEVAEIAKENKAIVIPAHIDEYNGLGNIGYGQLQKFLDLENINAVQVVHKPFFEKKLDGVSDYLSNYYPLVKSKLRKIEDQTIKNWYRPVKLSLEKNMSILTFSDNPHEERNSQHGIWGIGTRYTWIKMDFSPSLEGLRQAFLMPKFRIINDFVAKENPNKEPKLSIKSLTLINTTLNNKDEEFVINFHHQLNTIIGGPGSGKSSLLKCIRGILQNTNELKQLNSILQDHEDFYRKTSSQKKGIFTDKSVVKLSLQKNGTDYEIIAKDIRTTDSQNISIYRVSDSLRELQPIETLSFFKTEHYSQKHIFEIAKEPNSLRERIDNAIENMNDKKTELEQLKSQFSSKSAEIRKFYSEIYHKKVLIAEINDIKNQIAVLDKSGVEKLLKTKESYENQLSYTKEFKKQIKEKQQAFSDFRKGLEIEETIDFNLFSEVDEKEIQKGISTVIDTFNNTKEKLIALEEELSKSHDFLDGYLKNSEWFKGYQSNLSDLDSQKEILKKEGVDDFTQFNKLAKQKAEKEHELREMLKVEKHLEKLKVEKTEIQDLYFKKASEISIIRKTFLGKVLKDKNVQIKVDKFRDKLSFEKQVRKIINRDVGFENDIKELIKECFKNGRIEDNLDEFREKVRKIRNEDRVDGVRKYLNNLFGKLDNNQVDKLQILVPEDEITISYKPKGGKKFLPLSNASAGQKTTAILTFLLSFGDYPLILDQPEDDLNGKLVYDLIVDRLQEAKSKRQMIIVTHNANIPVNADSELITCLSPISNKLKISLQGTIDIPEIKKEICDVMEGSVDAFDMRAKRYSVLKKK